MSSHRFSRSKRSRRVHSVECPVERILATILALVMEIFCAIAIGLGLKSGQIATASTTLFVETYSRAKSSA